MLSQTAVVILANKIVQMAGQIRPRTVLPPCFYVSIDCQGCDSLPAERHWTVPCCPVCCASSQLCSQWRKAEISQLDNP